MAKKLMIQVNISSCTGCHICEMVCTIHHEGVVNLDRAKIHITDNFDQSLYEPHICQLCDCPPCVDICPTGALHQEVETGVIKINDDLCNGCEQCVESCPIEAVRWSDQQQRLFVCDRCGGEPVCVEFCTTKALMLDEEGIV